LRLGTGPEPRIALLVQEELSAAREERHIHTIACTCVQIEFLSDHVGEQLRRAEADVVAWQDEYRNAEDQRRAARRAKAWWKRALALPTRDERSALARKQSAWNKLQQIKHRVEQNAAGLQGENALAEGLSSLSDDWVMLRGYRNRRGETDHVLVGPSGVWAIEVKRRPVRLYVSGDEWSYEKLDRWGNVVETGWATDRSGRSWARQVNDVAEDLAAWLQRSGRPVPVRTAVMLMHERAGLGELENVTVNVVANNVPFLLDQISEQAWAMTRDDCESIVELVRRDHVFHSRRRRPRR
jgi:hypothetical protein